MLRPVSYTILRLLNVILRLVELVRFIVEEYPYDGEQVIIEIESLLVLFVPLPLLRRKNGLGFSMVSIVLGEGLKEVEYGVFLSLETNVNAAFINNQLMLFLKDGLKVLLIEVNPSELVDDLVNGGNQSHSFLEMMMLVDILGEESNN